MKKIILWLMLVLVFTAANAGKIYKYVDENGVTHYSDRQPEEEYQEANPPELSIIPSTPVQKETTKVTETETPIEEQENILKSFKITQPTAGQHLWGTAQQVTASVYLPNNAGGYQVQFVIDGKPQAIDSQATQTFSEIHRGEHQIQARLIDALSGKTLTQSQTVTFFMQQHAKK